MTSSKPAQSGVRPPDGGRARAAGAGRAGVLSAQEQRARAVCARAHLRRITACETARLRSKTATCAGQEPDRVWITRGAEGTRAGESSVRACGARSNSERLRREGTARSGLAQHGGGGWSGPSAPLAPPLKVTEKAPGWLHPRQDGRQRRREERSCFANKAVNELNRPLLQQTKPAVRETAFM